MFYLFNHTVKFQNRSKAGEMNIKYWWNNSDSRKLKSWRKTCVSATMSTINPTGKNCSKPSTIMIKKVLQIFVFLYEILKHWLLVTFLQTHEQDTIGHNADNADRNWDTACMHLWQVTITSHCITQNEDTLFYHFHSQVRKLHNNTLMCRCSWNISRLSIFEVLYY